MSDVAGRKQILGFHRCSDQGAQTFQFRVTFFFFFSSTSLFLNSVRVADEHPGLFIFLSPIPVEDAVWCTSEMRMHPFINY